FNPLKTYKELVTDPLSSLTASLAKMSPGEGAAIQIIAAPASGWQGSGKGYISSTKKEEADMEKASFKVDAKTLEAIENKISKPGFEVVIRIVVSSTSQEQAEAHLSNIKGSFEQFSSHLNSFSKAKIRLKKFFMIDFIYRYFPLLFLGIKHTVLTSEELATIFHFPNKTVETPHIHWVYAKSAPAPVQIPKSGLYIGKSTYRGLSRPVHLGEKDRRRHAYIIGKTGVGKSELLKDMILQDIRSGKGVCLIDPHDLADELLDFIPPERAEDVIYFNPSDSERPMGFNLLEAETEEQKHFVTGAIINLMYKLYDPYKTGIIGPRFEHAIRNAMLTVMSDPGSTFIEIVRCLTDSKYVQELLPKVKDPMVRRYWTDQIAQTSDFHKSEVLDYIVSKFGRFVTNKTMRNIIGQSKSAFDFRTAMDQGKILIVNLAKGKLGEENSAFLGLVLVPKILIAAMSRADIPQEKRRDFYLYVDEFQNFATPDFAQILSEARKYRLSLTVANQFIGQMEEEVKNAIFGNVGTIMAFRVGVTDASYLSHEFQPVFAEDDLLNIERFHVYMKTIVGNEPVQPFSVDLYRDMAKIEKMKNKEVGDMIRNLSRLKYGKDRQLVESEIAQRAKL
ncbi:type IV secretory system conjugative DNA transfer family protein, partial [Patescibacteria group bacterium]